MASQIDSSRSELLELNHIDVINCNQDDQSLLDRLVIDNKKIDGMIASLEQLIKKESPLNRALYTFKHDNGIVVTNKTVPFGVIMIIYESRPDVIVEAAATALKSGNKIILKGGKEAKNSNIFLHKAWQKSLSEAGYRMDHIRYLNMDRRQLQEYLKEPDSKIDLIIPRGGEKLIDYVKSVAKCPVLVSGRGNNFLYVSKSADLSMAKDIIVQSKVSKISACNALDKVLIDQSIPSSFRAELVRELNKQEVVIIDSPDVSTWKEEFLDKKIVIEEVADTQDAIETINKYSGGHSAAIISQDEEEVNLFMQEVDCAAVYHNASTRFTDGYQFGLGAEMAISTQKLHHRGPIGVEELVTNKWYIVGDGQTR